jgi:hypothetical protein
VLEAILSHLGGIRVDIVQFNIKFNAISESENYLPVLGYPANVVSVSQRYGFPSKYSS